MNDAIVSQAMDQLNAFVRGKDWFYDMGTDQFGRVVVYVHYMNKETLHDIPLVVDGKHVLVHFAASAQASAEKFVETVSVNQLVKTLEAATNSILEQANMSLHEFDVEEENDLSYLQNELDRLEKLCGTHTLELIFYEEHDKHNAVTNMSARYPEVRKVMEKLYDMYGFDLIYENIDG